MTNLNEGELQELDRFIHEVRRRSSALQPPKHREPSHDITQTSITEFNTEDTKLVLSAFHIDADEKVIETNQVDGATLAQCNDEEAVHAALGVKYIGDCTRVLRMIRMLVAGEGIRPSDPSKEGSWLDASTWSIDQFAAWVTRNDAIKHLSELLRKHRFAGDILMDMDVNIITPLLALLTPDREALIAQIGLLRDQVRAYQQCGDGTTPEAPAPTPPETHPDRRISYHELSHEHVRKSIESLPKGKFDFTPPEHHHGHSPRKSSPTIPQRPSFEREPVTTSSDESFEKQATKTKDVTAAVEPAVVEHKDKRTSHDISHLHLHDTSPANTAHVATKRVSEASPVKPTDHHRASAVPAADKK
jgi:hypothetical protein